MPRGQAQAADRQLATTNALGAQQNQQGQANGAPVIRSGLQSRHADHLLMEKPLR